LWSGTGAEWLGRIALNAYGELRLAPGSLMALVTEADYPGLTSQE
jgi:hypothetical protein